MDWFERLTGFREQGYDATRGRLVVDGGTLRSSVNGRSCAIGTFEMASLRALRERLATGEGPVGRITVGNVSGDVRRMHQAPENAGALFQVASQFNVLEMVGPSVTPEDGVTRYASDMTQGPACSIAAGAATIYRNYFVPVGEQRGQTAERQLDGLADLGDALATALGRSRGSLWTMRNGYALPAEDGLAVIAGHLRGLDEDGRDRLRALLRVGLHTDVEVTDAPTAPGQRVSQAFCSALPVAYSGVQGAAWAPFATLVLEAAYEATLSAAVLGARAGRSNVVLLTRLGGGAFGNDDAWIDGAMLRALERFAGFGLDVRIVSYGAPPRAMVELARRFS